jgi:hypothetical protein
MKNNAPLSAIAACLVLAACSEMQMWPDSRASKLKGCKAGNCMVKLTVTTDATGNCTAVKKDPDPRGVWAGDAGNPQRNVDIVWQIVASGTWEFDANGVDFGGSGQFNNPRPDASKKKYTWNDKNDSGQEHNYSINLVDPHGGRKCTRDPSVVNDTTQPE